MEIINFFSVNRANSQKGSVPRLCTTEDSIFLLILKNLGNHSTMVDNCPPSKSPPCLVGVAKEPAELLTHLKGRQQVLKISLS